MSHDSEKRIEERLASLEREVEHLQGGLELLGIKPCSWCSLFYRGSDPGSLFDCGELVCFACVSRWWLHRSPELSIEDREKKEFLLRRWLVAHHGGEVIGQARDLPDPEHLIMKLVTGCQQCNARGKTYSGKNCGHCDGRGTVWVIVRAPEFAANE